MIDDKIEKYLGISEEISVNNTMDYIKSMANKSNKPVGDPEVPYDALGKFLFGKAEKKFKSQSKEIEEMFKNNEETEKKVEKWKSELTMTVFDGMKAKKMLPPDKQTAERINSYIKEIVAWYIKTLKHQAKK